MYNFKYGYIYKITNLINGKIYIGQVYNKSVEDRFIRHYKNVMGYSSIIDKAIAKYGKENFIVETIDICYSIEDCNNKEKYWIKYYNSTDLSIGYNLTPGGEGGNTYMNKSKEELEIIKQKISNANKGRKNGNSNQLKCKSIITNKEFFFETLTECCQFFNIKNKAVIMERAHKVNNTLFRHEWLIAFENEDYKNYNIPKIGNSIRIKLINLTTNEEIIFNSKSNLYKYLDIKYKLKFPSKIIYFKNYKLELLD